MTDTLPVLARKTCRCRSRYCNHHAAIRAALAIEVAAGRATCWRCRQPIKPDEVWDVGHADEDPNIWRGPEHASENRATSTRRKARKRWTL